MKVFILACRISGLDGVSLEAEHWKEVLERMGHSVTFIAGKLDRAGILLPELHFQWPKVVHIHDKVVYSKNDFKKVEAQVFEIAGKIEGRLREVLSGINKTDLLIVPNVLSLPMHFPLAVALARTIDEFNINTIARHHDFWWERDRYNNSSLFHFFERWFPPNLPTITHIVINSEAKRQLKKRTGIDAEIIWDSFDYSSTKINNLTKYSSNFRADFGLNKDDIIFLQATRIVPRKRIEMSIELVKKLSNPKVILIVAGHSGDEGKEYEKKLRKLAKEAGIRFKFIGDRINAKRRVISINDKRVRSYTLWDTFNNADFIVYPTEIEGFGNQFVEAVYFKKPIILTPYPVYKEDIAPLGFEAVVMPDKVTNEAINEVRDLISDPQKVKQITQKNFKLGEKYLSYDYIKKKLKQLKLGI